MVVLTVLGTHLMVYHAHAPLAARICQYSENYEAPSNKSAIDRSH